jgi:hypothetical protein
LLSNDVHSCLCSRCLSYLLVVLDTQTNIVHLVRLDPIETISNRDYQYLKIINTIGKDISDLLHNVTRSQEKISVNETVNNNVITGNHILCVDSRLRLQSFSLMHIIMFTSFRHVYQIIDVRQYGT